MQSSLVNKLFTHTSAEQMEVEMDHCSIMVVRLVTLKIKVTATTFVLRFCKKNTQPLLFEG